MPDHTIHRELLQRTVDLLAQTDSVELFIPEETGLFSIDNEHIGLIRELIGATIELLRDASHCFEELAISLASSTSSANSEDVLLFEIGAQISSEIAAREISDLSFVARGQLIEIQEALEAAFDRKQTWVVASYADTGLRRLHKALIRLESAVSEFEGEPAPDRKWKNLHDSLEIRRLYSQFRRAVLRGDVAAEGETLDHQLKSSARRIAILRDLKIYPFLRIDDRLSIRQLHRRIGEWSRSRTEARDEDGRRIWQDLASFARLLSKINEREELREHDRRIVQRLLTLTARADSQSPLTDPVRQEFDSLVGRDDELDQLLLQPGPRIIADLLPYLDKLRAELLPDGSAWNPGELPSLAGPKL